MKKSLIFALLICMLSAFAAPAFAAQAEAAKLSVFIDDQKVDFRAEPILVQGTTMVEFKTAFEKLGYQVQWDQKTKTVTGSSEGATIRLQSGSLKAVLNGEAKALAQAPQIVNGVTFVPLRFVGEFSGREVSWDNRTKTVYIANTEQQIYHVIQQNFKYTQNEDIAGVMSTIDEQSPVYQQQEALLQQTFAAYDLNYKIVSMKLLKVENNQAQVQTVQQTSKVSGPAFNDSQIEAVQTLVKTNGSWKLYSTTPLKIDFMEKGQPTADLYKQGTINLSDDEQKKVLDVIEQDRALGEKEDFDGEKALYMSDFPNLEEQFTTAKYLAATYDFKFENESATILQASADQVQVKAVQKVTKVKGPAFTNFRQTALLTLKKDADGSWKFADLAPLSIEYLYE